MTAGGCPTSSPAEVTLSSGTPIGDRPVVLNQEAWVRQGGTFRRCDDDLGCRPPKDHCDRVWVRAAVRGLDVSRHSQGGVESCDGRWLVMTVPDDPAQCGAAPRPGCTVNTAVHRYFLGFHAGAGWRVVARTTDGGCDAVRAAVPDFPSRLCADLAPTRRYVTTAPSFTDRPPGG